MISRALKALPGNNSVLYERPEKLLCGHHGVMNTGGLLSVFAVCKHETQTIALSILAHIVFIWTLTEEITQYGERKCKNNAGRKRAGERAR